MRGYSDDADRPIYYVYAWYYANTGEIFYIGKGKNGRYMERKVHRNRYFVNILNKHGGGVRVKLLETGLTEQTALSREKALIDQYWKLGQCKANLHEGGCGGNTGKYGSAERSKKLSESAKKRTGPRNSMYGRTHSAEARLKMSLANVGKRLSEGHRQKLKAANTGRIKTADELKRISAAQKGRRHSKEQTLHSNQALSKNIYEVFYKGQMLYRCVNFKTLASFCGKFLYISRTILPGIISQKYVPKFNRHKWIADLKITETDKNQYADWRRIFSDSMEDVVDKPTIDHLTEYVKNLGIQAKVNRYGKRSS